MTPQQKYLKEHPWARRYFSARARCNNPKHAGYKYYGGKGVKCLMTLEQFKELWIKDKADLMKRPSIDRIDSDGNYCIENCHFIELSENSRKVTQEKPSWITRKGCKHSNGMFGKYVLKPVPCSNCQKMFKPVNSTVMTCSRSCARKLLWKNGTFEGVLFREPKKSQIIKAVKEEVE